MKNLFSLINYIIQPFKFQTQKHFDPPIVNILNDNSGKTKFYLNDPTTPNLIGEESPPDKTCFPMDVKGDKGPGYSLGSAEQQASACKLVINNLLTYYLVLYKFVNSERKLDNWARRKPLSIVSRAGASLNAYYDRSSLKFFYYKSPNKLIYTCDSTPVVCHEFGHAFLDALRPDFWSTQSFEVWAYHESFGDISSIISSFHSNELIRHAIEETNGDLLKSNIITRIAAEMGKTYHDILKDKNGTSPHSLRDASVVYNYITPENLPKKGRDDELIYESHNFSRVFTGAFYEVCIKVANKIIEDGTCKDLLDAVKLSRDICFRYLLKATATVPVTVRLYEALAKQMLLADRENGSKYQDVIKEVFLNRNILSNNVTILENKNISDVKKELKNDSYIIESTDTEKVIRVVSTKKIKILDKRILNLKNSYIYGLEIEVPNQSSYFFNDKDQLVDYVGSSEDEVIDCSIDCLNYLDQNKLIGNHEDAIFEVKQAKIVRSKIKCKCLPNYCDPNAPEFNKPWKPSNHSSCCKCVGDFCRVRPCSCNKINNKADKKDYCSNKLISCISGKYSIGQFLKRKVCSN